MSQYTFPSDNVIGFQTNMSTYNDESDFVKLHEETIVENEISLDAEIDNFEPIVMALGDGLTKILKQNKKVRDYIYDCFDSKKMV